MKSPMSKRQRLASVLEGTGVLRALEWLHSKPGILIINHHRIGDGTTSRFDREVFSATEEEFDAQIKYFKKHFNILCGEEVEALITGAQPLKHMHVYFTFDDGYLDNYTSAFRILRANQITAAFFLVPQFVGTNHLPWWDEIAYRVRNTSQREIALTLPVPIQIPTEPDREAAIHAVLQHYKRTDNRDSEALLAELRHATGGTLPTPQRRFLNWEEAREMHAAGMVIGSHTCSHPVLSQLPEEQQRWELEESRREIEKNLHAAVTSLAYPVGIRTAFNSTTRQIAASVGYKMAFSYDGGVNLKSRIAPMDILRGTPSNDPLLFRTETVMMTRLGKLLY